MKPLKKSETDLLTSGGIAILTAVVSGGPLAVLPGWFIALLGGVVGYLLVRKAVIGLRYFFVSLVGAYSFVLLVLSPSFLQVFPSGVGAVVLNLLVFPFLFGVAAHLIFEEVRGHI